MTIPAFLFGVLVSTLIGAIFHLWKGGGPGRIFLYVFLCWIGFWIGHYLGNFIQWTLWDIGPLKFGFAISGSVFLVFLGYWLSNFKSSKPSRK